MNILIIYRLDWGRIIIMKIISMYFVLILIRKFDFIVLKKIICDKFYNRRVLNIERIVNLVFILFFIVD